MTDVAPLSHSNNLVYPHRLYQRLFQNNTSTSSARNNQIRQGIVLPIEYSSQDAPYAHSEGGLTVDVSDAFDLTFKANGILPNIIILSSDNVFFLVHYHKLVTVSHNNFGWLIPPTYGEICNNLDYKALELCLAETTEVLNVLLCTIYGMPCDTYHPSFQCLLASLEAIKKYGLCLQRLLIQGKPLYNTFLNHIPIYPLEIYAIAGENGLEDLAVASSSYTLSHSVHAIPDYLIVRIGDRYMQRLRNLHAMRMGALKNMFEIKLYPHVRKPYCSVQNRSIAESAFRLKGTEICRNGHPGISGAHIETAMCYWVDSVPCPDCRATMHTRVGEIIREWVLLKRTI